MRQRFDVKTASADYDRRFSSRQIASMAVQRHSAKLFRIHFLQERDSVPTK